VSLRLTRVSFRDDAMQDLRRLAERSQPVLVEVFRLLKALDAGTLVPVSLHDYTKTRDPTDCVACAAPACIDPAVCAQSRNGTLTGPSRI
jgi:hypothetical protein